MKKNYLLMCAVFISITLAAQSPFKTKNSLADQTAAKSNFRISAVTAEVSLPGRAITYTWENNQYSLKDTTNYTYDPEGHVLSAGNSLNRTFYTYNKSGLLTSKHYQYFSYPIWIEYSKYIYAYDDHGNVILQKYYDQIIGADSFELAGENKSYYTYDAQGRQIQIIDLDSTSSGFDTTAFRTITYENDVPTNLNQYTYKLGHRTGLIRYTDLVWKNYDPNSTHSEPESYTIQNYKYGKWVDSLRSYKTKLDDFGSEQHSQSLIYGDILQEVSSYTIVYNDHGDVILNKFGYFEDGKWVYNTDSIYFKYSGIDKVYSVELTTNENQTSRDSVVYSDYQHINVAAVADPMAQSFLRIFPQPAIDQLTLEFSSSEKSDFKLLNNLGERMTSGILDASTTLNVGAYPAGIYFLQWEYQGKLLSRKLVIE